MSLPDNAEIVYVDINKVEPDPQNVNQHSDVNIAHIKASIERFGFADPIGVVKHPKKRGAWLVVEGHGRLIAGHEIGLDRVPIIVLTLDAASRLGYGIAHNQTQQISTMDMDAVAGEFERLNVSADDYISLGFSQEDVLFMPSAPGTGDAFSRPDGEDYQEGEQEPEKEKAEGSKGFIPVVHRSALRFANDVSYNRFIHALALMRARHPTAATMGERLQLLLGDIGFVGTPESPADV
jgi:hypothetical protein